MTYRERTLYELALAQEATNNALKHLAEIEVEYISVDALCKTARKLQRDITATQEAVRQLPNGGRQSA